MFSNFYKNELPSFVKDFLYVLWDIDDFARGNNIIVALNITVIHLRKIESVLFFSVGLRVCYVSDMLDRAFAPE